MTRPDAACYCVTLNRWAAISVQGEGAEEMLAAFHRDHQGEGHVLDPDRRDWYGKQAALNRHLDQLRRERQ